MRTTEPTMITTGETVEWTKYLCDYPASEWTLAYYFRGPGVGFNIEAVADGDEFAVTVPGTTSDNVTVSGSYKWESWVTNIADTSITHNVDIGFTNITLRNVVDNTDAVDLRSTAKKIVDAIDAALLVSAGDVIEYEISTPAGTRKVKKSRTDAIATRDKYAAIVARELDAERTRRTGKFGRTYLGRMP